MPLYTRSDLARSNLRSATLRRDAREVLAETRAAPLDTKFDIFLSHRYLDANAILSLKQDFEELGHSVYVDWVVDDLDRNNVTRETANRIRTRMQHSRSL